MGVWIARAKCGCVTAASFDGFNRDDLAKDIGQWILDGNVVEHLDVNSIQLSKCSHKKEA